MSKRFPTPVLDGQKSAPFPETLSGLFLTSIPIAANQNEESLALLFLVCRLDSSVLHFENIDGTVILDQHIERRNKSLVFGRLPACKDVIFSRRVSQLPLFSSSCQLSELEGEHGLVMELS